MTLNLEQVVRENLDKTVHMSLATSADNKPWVCEVHFAYDDSLNLYFRSLTARRHSQEIAKNPSVAGTIVKQHALAEYPLGVYFEGSAQLLEPGEEQTVAANCLRNRLEITADIGEEALREDGHQFYKIAVDKFYVFGKFGDEGGKKYELAWAGGKR
jgi:uncharacterized protein YhbP (UPF0306 family)